MLVRDPAYAPKTRARRMLPHGLLGTATLLVVCFWWWSTVAAVGAATVCTERNREVADEAVVNRACDSVAGRWACGHCNGWEADYIREIFDTTECRRICTKNATVYVRSWWSRDRIDHARGGYPSVLFDISDEACRGAELWEDYANFDLVLRQYSCSSQFQHLHKLHPHVHVIPLGYMAGMLPSSVSSVTFASATLEALQQPRRYAWSFAGTLKGRRAHLLSALKVVRPNQVFLNNALDKREMASLYGSSYFVLCPRGYVNLDSFRHYEASLAGAIPIVVGTLRELNETFGSFGEVPPWVMAPTPLKAIRKVRTLLRNPVSLRRRQADLLLWVSFFP